MVGGSRYLSCWIAVGLTPRGALEDTVYVSLLRRGTWIVVLTLRRLFEIGEYQNLIYRESSISGQRGADQSGWTGSEEV